MSVLPEVEQAALAIEAMELAMEEDFLARVKAVSIQFPRRLITAVGGMGTLYVNIDDYQLSHGDAVGGGPSWMYRWRDYLFKNMEEAEEDFGSLYHFRPMVACDVLYYRNGYEVPNET